MATITVLTKIDGARAEAGIVECAAKLDSARDGMALDFSGVQRLDTAALAALAQLAAAAREHGVRLTLIGVTPTVYKVLKLMTLSGEFSFIN